MPCTPSLKISPPRQPVLSGCGRAEGAATPTRWHTQSSCAQEPGQGWRQSGALLSQAACQHAKQSKRQAQVPASFRADSRLAHELAWVTTHSIVSAGRLPGCIQEVGKLPCRGTSSNDRSFKASRDAQLAGRVRKGLTPSSKGGSRLGGCRPCVRQLWNIDRLHRRERAPGLISGSGPTTLPLTSMESL